MQYYGQTPLYQQQSVVIVPIYRSFWMNHILTTKTPNLKAFCIISGIIYTIWSLAIISLEVVIGVESHWTFYRHVWTSGFVFGGGISMFIGACQRSYSLIRLIRLFTVSLFFCLSGIILSSVNYGPSEICSSWYSIEHSCDEVLVSTLKVINLSVVVVINIHTLINIIVLSNFYKKILKSSVSNVQNR